MKELIGLILFLPIGLIFVLNNSLSAPVPIKITTAPVVVGVPVNVADTPVPVTNSRFTDLFATASSWINTPYLWGGCNRKGIDCSCFVMNVFAVLNIHLPRTSSEQIKVATPVPLDKVASGDLVFFDQTCTNCGPNPTHVGIVVSHDMMIDAGAVGVQIEPIYTGHNARYGRVMP